MFYTSETNPGFFLNCKCVDSCLKVGSPGILCKLDLKKAEDHVS